MLKQFCAHGISSKVRCPSCIYSVGKTRRLPYVPSTITNLADMMESRYEVALEEGWEMDHEKLLAKYIEYIVEVEGTDYLGFDCTPAPFAEAEWDELRRLAVGVNNVYTTIAVKIQGNQAIVRKTLINDDLVQRFMAKYGLSTTGEWVWIKEGESYPDECLLPAVHYGEAEEIVVGTIYESAEDLRAMGVEVNVGK